VDRKKKFLKILVIGLIFIVALALPSIFKRYAQATNVTGTATFNQGTLSLIPPTQIVWAATLTGYDMEILNTAPYQVDDATGTGNGWNVSADYTGLTDSVTGLSLANNAMTTNGSTTSATATTAPSSQCVTTCTLPTPYTTPTYPVTVPVGTTSAIIYAASQGSGEGDVEIDPAWWLAVPADTLAGTYTGTITMAVASGP
jgi:hypothetical protein